MNNIPLFKDKIRKNLINKVYWCCVCGRNKEINPDQEKINLLVHHILKKNDFPNLINARKNLAVVCTLCHRHIHSTLYDFGCHRVNLQKNSTYNVYGNFSRWREHKPCVEYFEKIKKDKEEKRKNEIEILLKKITDKKELTVLIYEKLCYLYGEKNLTDNSMFVAMEIKKAIGGNFIFGRRFTNKTDEYYINSIECTWIRSEGNDYDPLHKNFWRNQKEECHPCDKYRIGINLLKHYVETFHWELDRELRSLLLDTKIEEILELKTCHVQ